MALYVFHCPGREHEGERIFEKFMHNIPKNVVNQIACPQEGCGAVAKRRFDKEIPSQAVIGLTPVSQSTTTKGSLANTTEHAFGKFKENPDGTVNRSERPFRDSGELDRYMNGANDLGPPKLDSNGQPIRISDPKSKYGYKYARQGAKLVKFGPNDAPSNDGVKRKSFRKGGVYRNGNVTVDWAPKGAEKQFGGGR